MEPDLLEVRVEAGWVENQPGPALAVSAFARPAGIVNSMSAACPALKRPAPNAEHV